MPVLDGIASIKMTRDYLSTEMGIPLDQQPTIIGVTGHVMEEFKKKGLTAGMDKVVEKPVHYSVINNIINS